LPDRTVAENVAFPLEVRGVPAREAQRKVAAILASVALDHKLEKFPLSLSGGEQQRVAVARALVNDPGILLADEPTGNLDPERTLEVMELISRAHARGTTVIVATHDRGILDRYRKRVVTLSQGRIVADGEALHRAVS
jgi:cell division transport system ATP-binding protein